MTAEDATLIAALAGVIVPLLVALITKLNAQAGLKAFMNAGLSGVGGLLATVLPGEWNWRVFMTKWATAWVISIATYAGFYKPTGIAPAVQNSTANTGIG